MLDSREFKCKQCNEVRVRAAGMFCDRCAAQNSEDPFKRGPFPESHANTIQEAFLGLPPSPTKRR